MSANRPTRRRDHRKGGWIPERRNHCEHENIRKVECSPANGSIVPTDPDDMDEIRHRRVYCIAFNFFEDPVGLQGGPLQDSPNGLCISNPSPLVLIIACEPYQVFFPSRTQKALTFPTARLPTDNKSYPDKSSYSATRPYFNYGHREGSLKINHI
ncbi:uncharacterized protein An12g04460 [Aspergillus niger]|uniref:Contig An12c0130, genomic contig n=2 Tax=Aspergillus niger TaxID=5061 RepID=A2QZC6_ASPNC|nr:uncharacterized protein An12g04460 [Aspergillus niger]CAK97136.1 unnamed protein product [Aspergillus niger]